MDSPDLGYTKIQMPARSRPSTTLIYTTLILCLIIWGGTSVVSKVTVSQFPVFTTLFLRFVVANLLLIPVFIKDNPRRQLQRVKTERQWQLVALGVIGVTVQMGAFFVGIQYASVLDASLILALAPMLICFAGWIFLRERWSPFNSLGIIIATVGLLIALYDPNHNQPHSLVGNLGILISTLAIVAYAIGSKKVNKTFSPLAIITVSFMVGMITFAPLALWEYFTHPNLSAAFTPSVLWGILYLGIASSVIAYWLYEWALQHASAYKVGLLTFIQSLAGIILALLFLGEQLYPFYILGTALILIGVTLGISKLNIKFRL